MSPQPPVEFVDLTGLAKWVRIALILFAAAGIFMVFSSWLQIGLLKSAEAGAEITETAAASNDMREALSGLVFIIAYAFTAVLFLRWTLLTKKNALALGGGPMEISPAWGVGHYFVPVFNLWKPYVSIKETFRASSVPPAEGEAPGTGLSSLWPDWLPLWWTFWIASNVTGQIVFRMAASADTIPELLNVSWVYVWSGLLIDLPLIVLAWSVVTALQRRQIAKFAATRPVHAEAGFGLA